MVQSSLFSVSEIATGIVMLIVSSFILTIIIEEIGKRGKFSESFTGAVISPIFTAMPELIVIIIALVIVGKASGSEIAAGTIIGEPFMVSAVGFPIVAITLLSARKRNGRQEGVNQVLSKMLIFMGLVSPLMLIPWFFSYLAVKIAIALLLVCLYLFFFKFLKGKESFEEEATTIRIQNRTLLVVVMVIGVALLLGGSSLLVRGIDSLSTETGVSQELITILLVPIGTIVPETLNAVIWAARNKTNLAIGAMAGEEMIFVTIFPALGIVASQWIITHDGMVAIALTSIFAVILGLFIHKFRNSIYIFIAYFAALVVFLVYIY